MCDMALATAHAALIGHKGEGENGETNCDRWQDVGQYQRLRFLTGRPAPVQSQSLARYHGGDCERVPGGARAHSPEQASAHIADRPPGLTGFPQVRNLRVVEDAQRFLHLTCCIVEVLPCAQFIVIGNLVAERHQFQAGRFQ